MEKRVLQFQSVGNTRNTGFLHLFLVRQQNRVVGQKSVLNRAVIRELTRIFYRSAANDRRLLVFQPKHAQGPCAYVIASASLLFVGDVNYVNIEALLFDTVDIDGRGSVLFVA